LTNLIYRFIFIKFKVQK